MNCHQYLAGCHPQRGSGFSHHVVTSCHRLTGCDPSSGSHLAGAGMGLLVFGVALFAAWTRRNRQW